MMGLDTSHDCWHGAYTAFHRFRNEVARAAGWPMTEDGSDYIVPELPDKAFAGEWDRVPGDDPLIVFLAHSDCDGVIHPQHGRHIAKRLRELAPLMDDGKAGGHIWSMSGAAIKFADGLDAAADANEDVVFS